MQNHLTSMTYLFYFILVEGTFAVCIFYNCCLITFPLPLHEVVFLNEGGFVRFRVSHSDHAVLPFLPFHQLNLIY